MNVYICMPFSREMRNAERKKEKTGRLMQIKREKLFTHKIDTEFANNFEC